MPASKRIVFLALPGDLATCLTRHDPEDLE